MGNTLTYIFPIINLYKININAHMAGVLQITYIYLWRKIASCAIKTYRGQCYLKKLLSKKYISDKKIVLRQFPKIWRPKKTTYWRVISPPTHSPEGRSLWGFLRASMTISACSLAVRGSDRSVCSSMTKVRLIKSQPTLHPSGKPYQTAFPINHNALPTFAKGSIC